MVMEESKTVVASIEESVPLDSCYPTVSERYYTHYYYVPKKQMIRSGNTSTTSNEQRCIEKPAVHQNNSSMDTDYEVPAKKARLEPSIVTNCSNDLSESKETADNNTTVACDENMDVDSVNGGECTSNSDKESSNTSQGSRNCSEMAANSEGSSEYRLTGQEPLVMVHTNKLCVVSISPFHPIVRDNKSIAKVEYSVFGVDRLSNTVSGKGKRGAQVMGSKATICRLLTADGHSYNVTCGARGKLVQVNESLLQNPDLARTSCGSDGWLAIVMPKLQDYKQLIDALMPAQLYHQLWAKQSSLQQQQ